MKIALVSPYDLSFPGGVTEHTIALAKGLHQRGHNVQILAACSGYQNIAYPHTRTVTRHLATIPIRGAVARVGFSPLSYFRIKKILYQEKFDVIHLQEPLTPSITWWTLLSAYGLPTSVTIGTFHAYHEQPNWLYKHGRPIFGKVFTKLNNLIAVSKAAYNFAYQMFPGDYHIIPNGIDLQRFGKQKRNLVSNNVSPLHQKITILFVGRLDRRKGFSTLFQAFKIVNNKYPQLQLQVVGPFDTTTIKPFQKMAQNQGITNIDFVGYISPEQLPHYYHQADIFCAPSTGFESFGIVLLEAMAAGLPVVASDIEGYRCLVTNGQEGLLVPPRQPEALADALKKLIEDHQLRQKLGHYGYLKAIQYSWDDIIDKTLQVYWDTIKYNPKPQLHSMHANQSNTHAMARKQRRQPYHVKRSRTQI